MKKPMVLALALVIGGALNFNSPKAWAQNAQAAAQGEQQQPETQTFSGTVVKDGDVFLLKDGNSDVSYRIDDAEKAKEYEGKAVKVTGTLEKETNTIHVAKLEPAE